MNEIKIALAGNPNVGKSTVFNALTGMKQHTGNWPGKTVAVAQGQYTYKNKTYNLVDLPGTYSLTAHSKEEEVTRDYLCFGDAQAVVVVCDGGCLERNLNLVLQTLEIKSKVVVCVNLLDEAVKKGIHIDLKELSCLLGVPVVGTSARSVEGLERLCEAVREVCEKDTVKPVLHVKFPELIEKSLKKITDYIINSSETSPCGERFLAVGLLSDDKEIINAYSPSDELLDLCCNERKFLSKNGISESKLEDVIINRIIETAEEISVAVVKEDTRKSDEKDRKLDRIFLGKFTAVPIMLLLLAGIFWITIVGANAPSRFLCDILFKLGDILRTFLTSLNLPDWFIGITLDGGYRVLAWVVSVMLPPMAIFFPLFTLLEDFGYLPRVAFNLDGAFKKCKSCGKQSLTMCMGFGCNAVGVVGCRIIDSPRERLIAIITNSLVPCNGRFPTIIALISMFFVGAAVGVGQSLLSATMLLLVILFSVLMTFLSSRILSSTILKGVPSSFTLELPPYRKPQVGKVIVRSVFDRTLFVLGRAAAVAAPAGVIIWLISNVHVGGQSLLMIFSNALDPIATLMGLDGMILLAFILGFPANEIVLPIMIMAYLETGTIQEMTSLPQLYELLTANGWTVITAVCTLIFSLMHWPCSTTCLTIYKETGSLKWTAISIFMPTVMGFLSCAVVATTARFISTIFML